MNNELGVKRNLLISIIFTFQVVCFSALFLFLQNPVWNFPFLILLLFSASYLIFLNFEIGLIVYVSEAVFLALFLLVIKYPVHFWVYYLLGMTWICFKTVIYRRSLIKKLNSLSLEIESVKEQSNMNNSKYQEFVQINEAFEKKIYRFTNLRKFSEDIIASLDLNELLHIIAGKILEIIEKGEVSLIYLFDSKSGSLYLASSYVSSHRIKVKAKKGDPCEYWVFRQRSPLLITDITRDFRFDSEEVFSYGREFRSLVSAPVISRDKFLGLLRIDSASPEEFTMDDLRLLDIIADISAIAIDNAFLYQKMKGLATHDGLTGFYLRREFLNLLGKILKQQREEGVVTGLLMLDIDDFKVCNDTYGHVSGDLVLENIAHVIKTHLAEGEYPCRYGGEEFLILLKGKDIQEVVQRAELIRKAIEDSQVQVRRQIIKVTVSIGVAFSPQDGEKELGLIETSDARLYKSKRAGKNRVFYE